MPAVILRISILQKRMVKMLDSNRWIINRAGLINFWYYDEEVFDFSDGKLLLRGSNGSGKSVTMQSFIPLLLDGNKSPERLDPFGSKARRLENYLLGEEDNGKDENTGYLFMEFKKTQTGNLLTIGMGMKAVRGKPLQSWGFCITDGRRIGHDFYLYKNVGEKIPLTKKELENRIGGGGQVCDTSGDYMKMVNNMLFGFENAEEYDELIKLLVNLRSPKLSKDFKPTVIYEIMENSLQPLSEDDLRPMSEAIENMDNIKSKLDELKESKKAAEKIQAAYDRYNNHILLDKAKAFFNCGAEIEKIEKEKAELESKIASSQQAYIEAEANLEKLEIQKKTLEEKKKELERHDSMHLREKLFELENTLETLKKEKEEKELQLQKKKNSEIQLNSQIKVCEDKDAGLQQSLENYLEEMDTIYDDFAFDEHAFMRGELKKNIREPYNFYHVKNSLTRQMKNIEEAIKALQKEKLKNEEYDRIFHQLEASREHRNSMEKLFEQSGILLQETKEELIEKTYAWKKENIELKISDDALVQVSREINNFAPDSSFDDVISHIRKEYLIFEGELNRQMFQHKSSIDSITQQKKALEAEIAEWENKKDPEPARDEKVILNRKRLESEGIPFIPLYKAVDFKNDIPESIKGHIEEALLDMGLLDALIIPAKYWEKAMGIDSKISDKYLFASPNILANSLSEYLKVEKIDVNGITFEDVDNVLRSILIDKNSSSTYISENGEYGIGILKGMADSLYVPKYIGTLARKRFREEIIQKLQAQLAELETKLNEISEKINSIAVRLSILKKEYDNFPDKEDLIVAINQLKESKFNFDRSIEDVAKKEQEEKKLYEELKAMQAAAFELAKKANLKANLEIFENAFISALQYKDSIHQLENEHSKLIQNLENLNMLKENKLALEEDMDNISYDITSNRRKTAETQNLYQNCLEQLNLSDYQQIKQEIDDCIRMLNEIPQTIKEEAKRSEREKAACNQYNLSLSELNVKLNLNKELYKIYEEIFREDYNLGYVYSEQINENPYLTAKKVCREIQTDDKYQREDAIKFLFEKFQENSPYLREFMVKIDNIFIREGNSEIPQINEALAKSRRYDVSGKVRGKDVNFYNLMEYIKKGIEENENLLRDSDRQLFEDILVKNISKKIRAKIYHSEQWVKKINQLMESMNTSSGLSFSLKWSSKKAETEDQMDTSELVALLKQEGTIMPESSLNRLSEHFRSKIAEARKNLEESGKSQTFHSIMKEILDYKKWFEFKLYFIKTGQAKKELTNNAFYQFSGGEKAMAMYVPLFSAVYARYQGARKDCPRIISLDEAFAGVDEKNIRDMFRLLGELELDFIINSQILWGDYDTVPSLSICELLRPDNADFVTVIRYHWDGKVKSLLT